MPHCELCGHELGTIGHTKKKVSSQFCPLLLKVSPIGTQLCTNGPDPTGGFQTPPLEIFKKSCPIMPKCVYIELNPCPKQVWVANFKNFFGIPNHSHYIPTNMPTTCNWGQNTKKYLNPIHTQYEILLCSIHAQCMLGSGWQICTNARTWSVTFAMTWMRPCSQKDPYENRRGIAIRLRKIESWTLTRMDVTHQYSCVAMVRLYTRTKMPALAFLAF